MNNQSVSPRKLSEINTFRVHAPFFQQQKKNRFSLIFFVVSTGEKMKKVLLSGFEPESSPRKGDMIGRYTTGASMVQVAPRGFEPLSLTPKASMIDHYTTGASYHF
jgi:hypothetical protein